MTQTGVSPTGRIVGPAEVEERLLAACDWLDEMNDLTDGKLIKASNAAKEAEVAYKVKFAKTRVGRRLRPGTGPRERCTNDEADDFALEACEEEFRAYIIAQGVFEAYRDAAFAKRAQIEALRTVAANMRSST